MQEAALIGWLQKIGVDFECTITISGIPLGKIVPVILLLYLSNAIKHSYYYSLNTKLGRMLILEEPSS